MSTPSAAPKRRPTMYHSLEQVCDSGLIPEGRMTELLAQIESRLEAAYTKDGQPITNALVASFPDGRRMLYTLHDHDPQQQYCRRELLAALMTDAEIELVNACYSSAVRHRIEADRFARAEKVLASGWSGWVCDGDRFWDSVGSYLDEVAPGDEELCDGTEEAPCPYLWAAQPECVIPSFDVADVVGHWLDDRGWDEMDTTDLEGVASFQGAIDTFVSINGHVVTYRPDYTKAIILSPDIAYRTEGGVI